MLNVKLDREINLKVKEVGELRLRISKHRSKLPFIEFNTSYRKVKEFEIDQEEQRLDQLNKEIKVLNAQLTPITC